MISKLAITLIIPLAFCSTLTAQEEEQKAMWRKNTFKKERTAIWAKPAPKQVHNDIKNLITPKPKLKKTVWAQPAPHKIHLEIKNRLNNNTKAIPAQKTPTAIHNELKTVFKRYRTKPQ